MLYGAKPDSFAVAVLATTHRGLLVVLKLCRRNPLVDSFSCDVPVILFDVSVSVAFGGWGLWLRSQKDPVSRWLPFGD